MSDSLFEEKLKLFERRGDKEKLKWINHIDSIIRESQKKRIKENDKSVLQELFLPSWASWELLRSWACKEQEQPTGFNKCSLCERFLDNGVKFKEKFICENCFIELKNV